MSTTASAEPELLHLPDPDNVERARVQDYLRWLRTERGVDLAGWDDLQAWSVRQLEDFWGSVWDYFGVVTHTGYDAVLEARTMPDARWFTGASLNYAEHSLGLPRTPTGSPWSRTPRPASRAS